MKIANFKAECKEIICKHTFDAPLLSDFSYGEFIYSSIDSRLIRYYCGLDCMIWDFVDNFVTYRLKKMRRSNIGVIIQKVIGLVADRPNAEIYFTQDNYCPKCQSKAISIDENFKTGMEDYEPLSFNGFQELTDIEKIMLIEGYIKNHVK